MLINILHTIKTKSKVNQLLIFFTLHSVNFNNNQTFKHLVMCYLFQNLIKKAHRIFYIIVKLCIDFLKPLRLYVYIYLVHTEYANTKEAPCNIAYYYFLDIILLLH